MKKIIFTVALIAATSVLALSAQEKMSKREQKAVEVKTAIDSKRYVFVAERVFPTSGKTRILSSRYDLTVSPDTVAAYLPYFGRAYTAPIDPTEGGIKFTATDFTYEDTPAKKDSREIKIVTKDGSKRYELFLTVFPNGTASLTVNDVQRQTIRFNGKIEESSSHIR